MKRKDENIDQLFKEAFAGDTFKFQETYWQNAKQLIQESKPKAWYLNPSAVASIIALVGLTISATLFLDINTDDNKQSSTNKTSSFEPNTTNTTVITENKTSVQENSTIKSVAYSSLNTDTKMEEKKTSNPTSTKENDAALLHKSAPLHANSTTTNKSQLYISQKQSTSTNTAGTSAITQAQKTSFNPSNPPNGFTNSSTAIFSPQSHSSENVASREQVELLHLSTISLLDLWNESPVEEITRKNEPTIKKRSFHPITLRLSAGNMWGINNSSLSAENKQDVQNQNIELSAEYHFHKQWGVQLGLSYNQVLENQSYTKNQLIDNSYWNLADNSYWDYQNTPITVSDSTWWLGGWWYYPSYNDTVLDSNYVTQFDSVLVPKTDTTTKTINAEHRIKIIEIPIMITYNFWVKRWSIQLATGASVGIYSNSTGQLIKHGDPTTSIPTGPTFFKSVQYNYLLSTEVGYSLSENWQISVRPQMKMNLNSIYQNDSGFSQKFIYYGVNAGLVYRF